MSGTAGFSGPGRVLMAAGGLIFLAGLVLYACSRLGIAVPFGRLYGDISYSGKNFKVFVPITSMVIVSLLFTFIFNVLSRFLK
jgi:hypothetical protein